MNQIKKIWQEIKNSIKSLEEDIEKSSEKNNVSAGLRARKQLKSLKALIGVLTKELLISDAETKKTRKTKKANG